MTKHFKTITILLGVAMLVSGSNLNAQALRKAVEKALENKKAAESPSSNQGGQTQSGQGQSSQNQPSQSGSTAAGEAHLKMSKSPIKLDGFDQTQAQTSFTGEDFIYATLKFPKPIREMGLQNGLIAYLIQASNVRYLATASVLEYKTDSQNELDNPYYAIDVMCPFKDSRNPAFTQKFLAGLAKLEPGKSYQLRLKVDGSSDNRKTVPFVDVSFTLDLAKGGGIIKSLAENFANTALAYVELPKPARDDKPLAAEILKVMKSEGFDATKVIFSTDGWLTQKKPNGEIDHRSIFAYVVFKNKSGGCEYQEFRFAQDYVGGKFENRTYKSGGTGKGSAIGCDKLK